MNRLFLPFLLALLCTLTMRARAVSWYDFGYRHIADHGTASTLGHRTLLVILVEFTNTTGGKMQLAHAQSYYDNLIFNRFGTNTINGYFVENSNNRFFWLRAGITNLTLSASETMASIGDAGRFYSNVIAQTMIQRKFDFSGYTNSDAFVTPDELQILIVRADAPEDGNNRDFGDVKPEGFNYTVRGYAAQVGHMTDVSTICHELAHTLQTGWGGSYDHAVELYGAGQGQECLSDRLTIMSCSGHDAFFHFDPWHKMQFGWCEPRIHSLRAGGIATLWAPQLKNPAAPIILYDPIVGTNEFFMIEYRTPTVSTGSHYDQYVAGNGVVIWRVMQKEYHLLQVPRVYAGSLPVQNLWRHCEKCQGLHYIANAQNPILGRCPAGQQHSVNDSGDYFLPINNVSAPGQYGWRWCNRCQGLFWGPDELFSHCPEGGPHNSLGSGDYTLAWGANNPGQAGWRHCSKCVGLFYGPNASQSKCPADGGVHTDSVGTDFTLFTGNNEGVWSEGPPDFRRGTSTVWGSGALSPPLLWFDGTPTRTRLYVRPFTPGADSVTVEWLAEEDTWVHFGYQGVERGTFVEPFNSLIEALGVAAHGGIIKIKSSTTLETHPGINQRVTLQAVGGKVTIGANQ